MIGEISALGGAFFWALSSVIIKSQTSRFDAVFINALRCGLGAVFFVFLCISLGKLGPLTQSSLVTLLSLVGASLCVFVIADTMFFYSISIIGVSRTFPISCSSPIFTLIIAVAIFGKTVSLPVVFGFVAVVSGVFFVASSSAPRVGTGATAAEDSRLLGVILAFLAAIFWAAGANLLHVGLEEADVVAANALRLTVAAIPLTVLALFRERGFSNIKKYGWRSFLLLLLGCAAGSIGASILFVTAVKYAGAPKAAVLSAVAPLFAVPMARIFLKEKVTVRLLIGAVLSVIGIWLVITR